MFGLDGRLGNFKEHIDIPLKPGAVPVSLPPFPVSPAKQEVIDKQMDSWIQLGVIEPSKSPWAAPVFIVYQNGKPRMVIDLRKLKESVIPDKFPIPNTQARGYPTGTNQISMAYNIGCFSRFHSIDDDRQCCGKPSVLYTQRSLAILLHAFWLLEWPQFISKDHAKCSSPISVGFCIGIHP